jgi:tRNA U34 5-methylaminomethyl-2-thiouridine-forming methyltransferase MnmC
MTQYAGEFLKTGEGTSSVQLRLNSHPYSFQLEIEIIQTSDGSHSLYLKDKDETYHSKHGAIQESQHVFIGAGLKPFIAAGLQEIRILEVGFGTGLNALLTLLEAEKAETKIDYTSLEAFPLGAAITGQLNYGTELNAPLEFEKIHAAPWGEKVAITAHFSLTKIHIPLEAFSTTDKFNLIYFDAFAPAVQPELWAEEVFHKIFEAMTSGGILVTYCSKGDVRRAMIAAGFQAEKVPGPPGKREMLRATKAA